MVRHEPGDTSRQLLDLVRFLALAVTLLRPQVVFGDADEWMFIGVGLFGVFSLVGGRAPMWLVVAWGGVAATGGAYVSDTSVPSAVALFALLAAYIVACLVAQDLRPQEAS